VLHTFQVCRWGPASNTPRVVSIKCRFELFLPQLRRESSWQNSFANKIEDDVLNTPTRSL
jgi:hypothetical protein